MNELVNFLVRPYQVFSRLKLNPIALLPFMLVLCSLVVGSVANSLAKGYEAVRVESNASMDSNSTSSSSAYSVRVGSDSGDTDKTAMDSPLVIGFMISTTAFGTGLLYFLGLLITALYLAFVAKTFGTDIGFARWFAFSCWISVPLVLTSLGWTYEALTIGARLDHISLLAPLTWFDLSLGGYADVLRIDSLWIVLLAILGFKNWTQKNIGFVATAIVVPATLYMILAMEIARNL